MLCENDEKIDIKYISDKTEIKLEYKFEYNGKKIADVACIKNNKIQYIFEICNTHKTETDKRPKPWFEVDALTLINTVNENLDDLQSLNIQCIRNEKCKLCIEKEKNSKNRKQKAVKILYEWIYYYDNIKPFIHDRDMYNVYAKNITSDFSDVLTNYEGYCENSIDIFILSNGNLRKIIKIAENGEEINDIMKKWSKNNGVGIFHVNIDWILNQKEKPNEINCIEIYNIENNNYDKICARCENKCPSWVMETNKKSKKICKQCDIELFNKIYLYVPYSDKEEIKNYKGRFDGQCKKWFIDNTNKDIKNILKKWKECKFPY